MSSNKKIIPMKLPSMALTTGEPKDGSPEWMREFVHKHGSTAPLAIEKRRKRMSANLTILDDSIKKAQTFKKAAMAQLSRAINEHEAAIKMEGDQAKRAALEQQLQALKFQKVGQEFELGEHVRRTIVDYSIVEGLCLIIDSLTVRDVGESKSGKKGLRRFSVAGIMSDVAIDSEYITAMYRCLMKREYPLGGIPPEFDPNTEEFRKSGDDAGFEDEDILSDKDAEEIEKSAKIEDE